MKTSIKIASTAAALAIAALIGITAIAQTTQPARPPALHHHHAGGKFFDFKDPKGVNAVVFIVDSELEPFVGTASGVSGAVHIDFDHPGHFHGGIIIDTDSVVTTNPRMADVLHGAEWINATANPQIRFAFGSAAPVPNKPDTYVVNGALTIAGVTLNKTVTLTASHVPDGAKRRGGAKSGDLLVLRSNFSIDRKDFGIKTDMGDEKVGNKIDIIVKITGYEKK